MSASRPDPPDVGSRDAGTTAQIASRRDRGRRAMIVRMAGVALAVAAVAVCVRTLVGQWSTVSSALASAEVPLLVITWVVGAAAMSGLAVLWRCCLTAFGARRGMVQVGAWYFAGELGKYLPGGVWPVVGRGELARRAGVDRSVGYGTTLVALGVMCLGGVWFCSVLAPWSVDIGAPAVWSAAVLAVALGVLLVHPAVFGAFLRLVGRVTGGRFQLAAVSWGAMVRLILVSLPSWSAVGLTTVLATEALGFAQNPVRVAFAAVAAWIVGIALVPVPAGAGVRELAFVLLAGLDPGPATAVAAITRVLFVLVDAVMGLWALVVLRRLDTRNPRPEGVR